MTYSSFDGGDDEDKKENPAEPSDNVAPEEVGRIGEGERPEHENLL